MTSLQNYFTPKETNICKGLAIILLLAYHLFYHAQYQGLYYSYFTINGTPLTAILAQQGKVCVAIFLVLSGYGLTKSWNKARLREEKALHFVIRHLLKVMSIYWTVYLLFVPLGLVLGRSPLEVYQGNWLKGIADFLGLSQLLGWNSFNSTWWYMSVIILAYLLFPSLVRLLERDWKWILFLAPACFFFRCYYDFIPGIKETTFFWLLPFILGILMAQKDLFNCYLAAYQPGKKYLLTNWTGFLIVAGGMICLFGIRFKETTKIDPLYAILIIFCTVIFLAQIPYLKRFLQFVGEMSVYIFMLHNFIFDYYFREFIYSFKYPPLILAVLLAICLLIAWLLTKGRQLILAKFTKKILSTETVSHRTM